MQFWIPLGVMADAPKTAEAISAAERLCVQAVTQGKKLAIAIRQCGLNYSSHTAPYERIRRLITAEKKLIRANQMKFAAQELKKLTALKAQRISVQELKREVNDEIERRQRAERAATNTELFKSR